MTRQWTIAASIFFLWCFAVSRVQSTSTGPIPGATGVPAGGGFPAELTCASSECHGPGEANPDTLGKLELVGVPPNYASGEHYRLTLKFTHPTAMRWGFELTAVATQTMRGAGDFAPVPNDASTQRVTDEVTGRVYIEHGAQGRAATGIGSKGMFSWQFDWIAPTMDSGEVAFYASGNAANGDGSPGGDAIYSSGKPLAVSASARKAFELGPVQSHARAAGSNVPLLGRSK
jgi:hypothetical protein